MGGLYTMVLNILIVMLHIILPVAPKYLYQYSKAWLHKKHNTPTSPTTSWLPCCPLILSLQTELAVFMSLTSTSCHRISCMCMWERDPFRQCQMLMLMCTYRKLYHTYTLLLYIHTNTCTHNIYIRAHMLNKPVGTKQALGSCLFLCLNQSFHHFVHFHCIITV